MKYRDLITIFVTLVFVLSLAYTIGVNSSVWFVPTILFILLIFIIYILWIEK